MKHFLFSVLCFFVALSVQSNSLKSRQFGGHEADVYSVLPFERSEKFSKVIFTFQNNIDFPVGHFEGLGDTPHQNFTWLKNMGIGTFCTGGSIII